MESKVTYIHYGAAYYNPELFMPIENKLLWVKPKGGLWASRTSAIRGWKDWCEDEDFMECTEENSFSFTLEDGAHIVTIKDLEQLERLPHLDDGMRVSWDLLDFEKMLQSGVDAIEVFMNDALYFRMYGWDCDSLLVLNKDVIVQNK